MIVGILIIAALIALKMNNLRHKLWIIVLICTVLFLYTTASVVYAKNELQLDTVEGVFSSIKIYLGWLGNGFQNLKTLTGNAVKMDWSETNSSFLNKSIKDN